MSISPHGNLLTIKHDGKKNIAQEFDECGDRGIIASYEAWAKSLKGRSLRRKIDETSDYLDRCWKLERSLGISQQKRFSSSIIEEFLASLFARKAAKYGLECGCGVRCLTEINPLFMAEDIPVESNSMKDIDVAIYKTVHLATPARVERNHEVRIPLIGIETKSYMDKTMFASVKDTNMSLRRMLKYMPERTVYIAAPCDDAMDIEGGQYLRDMYLRGSVYFLRNQRRIKHSLGKGLDYKIIYDLVSTINNRIEALSEIKVRLHYRKNLGQLDELPV